MKIVLTTTTLVAILAIGVLGINNNSSNSNSINNAFAQEGAITPGGMNDTMGNESSTASEDKSIPEQMVTNATLAYAQEDEMMEMMDEDIMMTIPSNQSKEMKMNWTGTIDVKSTIGEAFKSKVTVNMIDAIKTALVNVGLNSTVKEAELTTAHGYLVYKIMVVDENMKKYKVIVDPGNGQVLMKKEITWDDEHKMKYGEEKYDKYGHDDDDDYDKKKMMMSKDKKY
ncbi:MAG TPA: PepSY domain-containing protein [Nitrososphaeraceae archaeon]|nr:PepSY domain-containing protein [Nitrososphaeraceae archaeon]